MHLCNEIIQVNLLRVVGQVVAELSLLLQDLVHLGGVRGGIVAAAGGGSGHGQNGDEHKLQAEKNVHIKSKTKQNILKLCITSTFTVKLALSIYERNYFKCLICENFT